MILNMPRIIPALLIYFTHRKNFEDDLNSFLNYGSRQSKFSTKLVGYIHMLLFHKEYLNILYCRLTGGFKLILAFTFSNLNSLYITTASNSIGKMILIVHGFSTIFNAESIGSNCQVYQQVTIGNGPGGKPTIGNNVKIYAGAIVAEAIKIGDNCIIGAGTVVTKVIPPNSTVVGAPFRIL